MLFVNCSGELPKHLSPSLRKLIIGAKGGDTHEFNCAIPSEWGEECLQLEELWLANSQIEGRLPESLGRMANLRLLDVRNNNLQDSNADKAMLENSLPGIVLKMKQ